MTNDQASKLNIDDTIYFEYKEGKVKSEIRGDDRISVGNDDITMGTLTTDIFLPSKHVIECSKAVAEVRKKFDEMKCFGANVNPDIYALLTRHWINMCNTEGDHNLYIGTKALFTKFTDELYAITNQANDLNIEGYKFLRR